MSGLARTGRLAGGCAVVAVAMAMAMLAGGALASARAPAALPCGPDWLDAGGTVLRTVQSCVRDTT